MTEDEKSACALRTMIEGQAMMTDDELNAAVAVEVMGDGYAARNGIATKTDRFRSQLWLPATDITDVFEVVERMRAEGYWWEMRCPAERNDERHVARFEMDANRGRYVFAASRADILPRAICEAVLEAVRSGPSYERP